MANKKPIAWSILICVLIIFANVCIGFGQATDANSQETIHFSVNQLGLSGNVTQIISIKESFLQQGENSNIVYQISNEENPYSLDLTGKNFSRESVKVSFKPIGQSIIPIPELSYQNSNISLIVVGTIGGTVQENSNIQATTLVWNDSKQLEQTVRVVSNNLSEGDIFNATLSDIKYTLTFTLIIGSQQANMLDRCTFQGTPYEVTTQTPVVNQGSINIILLIALIAFGGLFAASYLLLFRLTKQLKVQKEPLFRKNFQSKPKAVVDKQQKTDPLPQNAHAPITNIVQSTRAYICKSCGADNSDTAKFCRKCGKKL
jgi:hypothetical protein